MIKTTLIGDPVEHSVAPIMHTEIAKMLGMGPNDFAYVKTRVETAHIEEALDALELLGFTGGNVTLPHKIEAMKYLDADNTAQVIGAVNTFVFRDGKRYGYNTDWQGVVGALQHGGMEPKRRGTFVVLGSGGAARAAIYAAKQLGFEKVIVFYEEPAGEKTQELQRRADMLGVTLYPYDNHLEKVLRAASVIYNTTSTGMDGFDSAPFDLKRLDALNLEGIIAADAVFNPLETPFLRATKARGARTVDGVWWTVFQGYPCFALWTGQIQDPSAKQLLAMHDAMAAAISQH